MSPLTLLARALDALLSRLPDDLFDVELEDDWPLTVCVTHRRFIPCRNDRDNCWWSEKPEDVAAIRAYQRGDTDA